MARWLEVGERVYVNRSRVENLSNDTAAFYPTSVVEKNERSIRVDLPEGEISEWVSSKYAHRRVGLAVIEAGDFFNEETNLDPLCKGILQNARLLYGDDALVKRWKIRSTYELKQLFAQGLCGFADKIALIGHGARDGRLTVGSHAITSERIGQIVDQGTNPPENGWQFVCAICNSGLAAFGQTLSKFDNVDCVIGPRHSAHSSEMAQFIQSYLNWNLLAGYTTTVAAKYARWASTGTGTFTMWRNGSRQSLAS